VASLHRGRRRAEAGQTLRLALLAAIVDSPHDAIVSTARLDLEFERVQQQVIVAPLRDTGVHVYVRL
jgi:hypothetical protein